MCHTHTHARTEAGLMGKSEEERGRERMTLNRLGIGSGGRRSGNKREAKREKGGRWWQDGVEEVVCGGGGGVRLLKVIYWFFPLVLIPFCA